MNNVKLRISGGELRGFKILYRIKLRKVLRPTTERIKADLFNILHHYDSFAGKNVLDAFAGTGSLGIEAISRGASKVCFVESLEENFKLLNHNVNSIINQVLKNKYLTTNNTQDNFFVINNNFFNISLPFIPNYVFVDPPYRCQNYYLQTLQKIQLFVNDSNLLQKIVFCFLFDNCYDIKSKLQKSWNIVIIKEKTYGKKILLIFQIESG